MKAPEVRSVGRYHLTTSLPTYSFLSSFVQIFKSSFPDLPDGILEGLFCHSLAQNVVQIQG